MVIYIGISTGSNDNCCAEADDTSACNSNSIYTYPVKCPTSGSNDVCSTGNNYCIGGKNPVDCTDAVAPDGDVAGFSMCVGGTGVDCDGVQWSLDFGVVGTLDASIVTPYYFYDPDGTPMARLKVSVGSIFHDLCCRNHPHGAFCDSSNYPISQTINAGDSANNNCACLNEWRKAAWNLIRGRYWLSDFERNPHTSDLTEVDASEVRYTYFPLGYGTDYTSKTDAGITEVRGTRNLCAPAETELDCPSEDDNCKVPCWGTYCVACVDRDDDGCSKKREKRWNKDGRDHANAGDSDFCCSGTFRYVRWELTGTRYGICS